MPKLKVVLVAVGLFAMLSMPGQAAECPVEDVTGGDIACAKAVIQRVDEVREEWGVLRPSDRELAKERIREFVFDYYKPWRREVKNNPALNKYLVRADHKIELMKQILKE